VGTEGESRVATLHRNGGSWSIEFGGTRSVLPDGNGVRVLAVLLARPDEALHARDLLAPLTAVRSDERARVAVRRALDRVIRHVETRSVSLGWYLRSTVRTGMQCRFTPDPRHPVRWDVRP
jgi:hypothetical protein